MVDGDEGVTGGADTRLKNILVGLDGSHLAESALSLAVALAVATGAKITLLHVLEHEPPRAVHGEPHLGSLEDAQDYLSRVASALRGSGLAVDLHVHPNPERDVPGSIAAHASELNVDLIVLAAHGEGGILGFLLGRVPQQVAARAGRPVAIVPAPAGRMVSAIQRIMLPVDEKGDAMAALPLAEFLAAACQAELILLSVVPTTSTISGAAGAASVFLPQTASTLLQLLEDQAREALQLLADQLRSRGVAASIEVRRGDPAREIVKAASAHAVDVVILATHARAGLGGLWEGSVGPRVVASSPCPIILVPISAKWRMP